MMVTDSGALAARAGLLPPWWLLAVCALGLPALSYAMRLSSTRALPLFVTAVIILPWLPVPLPPAALLFSGPAAWLVWAIALIGVVMAGDIPDGLRRQFETSSSAGRRAPILAAVLALAVFAVSAWKVSPILPLGDEPHYLVIAQSLMKDADLKIENNHRQGDYRSYWKGNLRPDYLRRGRDGQIYSIHMPGLAVLIIPALALAGYAGVQAMLMLLAAAGAFVLWRSARAATGDAGAAWFAWAATALTTPFVFLSFTAFPDGVGSVLVMAIVAMLVSLDTDSRQADRQEGAPALVAGLPLARPWWWWAGAGLACAILPWLHPRYAVLAASLGIVLLARILQRPRALAAATAYLVLPALSAAGWFGYFYVIYGSLDPSSAYGHYTQMAVGNIAQGIPGLLFDQQFGLLPNAPVYALALAGLVPLLRTRRRLGIEFLVLILPYTLVTAAYFMWWGGASSPVRFLGPILLPLSIPIAMSWAAAVRRSTRAVCLSLLAISLALTAAFVFVDQGRFAYNTRDGYALWLAWASPAVSAARGLPSLFRTPAGTTWIEISVWIAGGLAAWLLARTIELRAKLSGGWIALAVQAGIVVLAGACVAASWRIERTDGLSAASGQLTVLRLAAKAQHPVAVSYNPLRLLSADAITQLMHLKATGVVGTATETWLLFPRLPAGRYRVGLMNQVADASLAVSLIVGRGTEPLATWRFEHLGPGAVEQEFELPVDVRSISLRGESTPPRAIGDVWLQPLSLRSPRSAASGFAMSAKRYRDALVYGIGENVYLEPPGIWAGAESDAQLVIQSANVKATQSILVQAGPVRTSVRLEAGDWRQEFVLEPGQIRDLELPVPDGGTLLRVYADRGFRPADTDPRSIDQRYLGVWIEFR